MNARAASRAPAPHHVEELRRAIASNRSWYHTIELAPGFVTPGFIDLRDTALRILPPPGSLAGRRALDVGTFDGFWTFELERRGAEVIALDLPALEAAEWVPTERERLERETTELGVELGHGFAVAAAALGSKARRIECNVYDLSPEAIGGPVDVVFVGAILLHLRDPVRALERVRAAIAPGGTLILLEPISLHDTVLSPRRPAARFAASDTDFNWWVANLATLRAWLEVADFDDVRFGGFHRPVARPANTLWLAALAARAPDTGPSTMPRR